ncbi:MAG TPA: carboxypeptidase-like regulatory domain-containing protein [Bryobacteraceae bacterium]|nr:carboxypeptidase-like regulatory domain-containing protein [Bryobacteraceae bacterium]
MSVLYRFPLLVAVLLPTGLLAQSGAGSIEGNIQDVSGAAIPNCQLHVLNQGTGVTNDTTSNTAGFYSVPGLFAGNYTITFTAPGMKKYQTVIALQNAQAAVLNASLAVGDVTEQVTVNAEVIQLATYDSGTVSTQLDSSRIDQLPQNGRNVLGLAQNTVPGVEAGGTRANGLMGEGMEYSQDGAPMTNRNFGGESNTAQAILPDPDAVQEAKFETVNSSAQFATPATAILTTKSGSNTLHGSMFETARNNYFGIAKARQNPANFAAPHLVRNEFGASIGGPLTVPKVYKGKNKAFFFVAFERFSLRQASNELVTVPTAAMRAGDFSGLVNSAGILQQLYDPNSTGDAAANYARTPFPNNQIPVSRMSPLAKTLYAATPLPQTADNPLVNSNYNAVNNTVQTVPNTTVRLDHVFNDNNRIYFRFTDIEQTQEALRNYPSNSPASVAGGGLPAGATGYQDIPVQTISGALGYSHTFSPTFFSETIVSQQWQRMYVQGNQASIADYEAQLGLPNDFGQTGFPSIGSNLIMPYGGSQWNYGMSQILSTLDENLTKVSGKHQLAFGFRYRHERFGYLSDRSPDQVSFSNLATAEYDPTTGANYSAKPNTGYVDADFFLGAASSYSENRNAPFNRTREQEFDSYVQDNYRVTRTLTLNLGLRWEAHPAPHADKNYLVTFDMKNDALVLPQPLSYYVQQGLTTPALLTNLQNLGVKFETPQEAGLPSSGFYGSWWNFLPRVAFAWTPSFGVKGTVIRGGYGEFIYPVPIRNSVRYLTADYPFTASYSQSYTAASQSPDGLPNYLLRAPQAVIAGLNSQNVVNTNSTTSLLPGISLGETLAANYPPAHVREANMTIEQPFGDGSIFRISYVFTHGSNLDQNYQYNNAPSTYAWEVATGTTPPTGTYASVATRPYDNTVWGGNVISVKTGWSNDSSLQLNYQRPFKNGFAYQIFYVFSRAFRVGGNTFRDSTLYPAADFAPGVLPAGMNTGSILNPSNALNRYENYKVDTAIPEHHLMFNGIFDLPVGRGKRFLRNSNRFLDALLGGYQVAFTGQVVSQAFQVASSNWGATGPIHVYGSSVAVNDCRSGVCHPSYLWFNGYISPTVIGASKNGISGLPANYMPYLAPINDTPGTSNFGNNNVSVTLKNGTQVVTAYSPGPSGANPFSQTILLGPFNYAADVSLYKVFSLTERIKLRVNVDAFNSFNIQGRVNPNTTDGVESLQTSYWTPRQIQFTARLSF